MKVKVILHVKGRRTLVTPIWLIIDFMVSQVSLKLTLTREILGANITFVFGMLLAL